MEITVEVVDKIPAEFNVLKTNEDKKKLNMKKV